MHTGIVVGVSGSTITCVEGNASNMVKKTSYNLSNSYVAGFGHPKYTEETDDSAGVIEVTANTGAQITVTLGTVQSGSIGAQVKTVQRILYARGIRDNAGKVIAVDGSFGPSTKQAVIKLQKQLFPSAPKEWDGAVGEKTWTAALTGLW